MTDQRLERRTWCQRAISAVGTVLRCCAIVLGLGALGITVLTLIAWLLKEVV